MNSLSSSPFQTVFEKDLSPERPFIVAAMCTADYAERGKRLAESCRAAKIPFVIYQVPTVHRSISSRGTADETFRKSNFIRFLLDEYHRPLLYVDADCVFQSYPERIEAIAGGNADMAIYNWLADKHTDCFVPVEMRMPSGEVDRKRFYQFSHSIDFFAPDQLICSGAVQFYADTAPARLFLEHWAKTIHSFPGTADDPCLDFTYNNFARQIKVSASWLPKDHARYAWWIYTKPVIDHPDFPNGGDFAHIPESDGLKRFYPERAKFRQGTSLFPRDCIIDTAERMILQPTDKGMRIVGPTNQDFWLAR
jgi:hypothetical protein